MTFLIAVFAGQQPQHGLHAVAPFHPAGGKAFAAFRDPGIVLAVGGKAHDIVPVIISQLRQMIAVKAGIVGENGTDFVLTEPGTQISDGFGSCTEDRLAELKAHKVFAEAIDAVKSVGLMQKLGMQHEGIQRSQTKDNHGNWADLYFYGLLEEDWRKHENRI